MYALIYDNKIQVGPRAWNYYFFYDNLKTNNKSTINLPRNEPGVVEPIVGEEWVILHVSYNTPTYDKQFQQLEGPFYDVQVDAVYATYNVVDLPLEVVKSKLKESVTSYRYEIENRGTTYVFTDNDTVGVYTNREDRNSYVNALLLMPDAATITFKFMGGKFKTVNKQELGAIVQTGMQWIQSAFAWESEKLLEIENCISIQELMNCQLKNPIWSV